MDRAIEDYNESIRLDPENAQAYNNRGVVFSAHGRHQEAINDFDQAIRIDDQFAHAYNL